VITNSTADVHPSDEAKARSNSVISISKNGKQFRLLATGKVHNIIYASLINGLKHWNQNKNKSASRVMITMYVIDEEKEAGGAAADRDLGGRRSRTHNCFHFYLVLGLVGFFAFWLILMLRIYLPESYWRWSYIW